jgi:hypothetical protein
VRDRRDEASSEFCVLSSEFETSGTGEKFEVRWAEVEGRRLKVEKLTTQNPALRTSDLACLAFHAASSQSWRLKKEVAYVYETKRL